MPECYTHIYAANHALIRCGQTVASQPAFMAGANGPNPLFMYKVWKRRCEPDLPMLAALMHRERTGAFLNTLVHLATTPVQQSYALGFLSHYASDCIISPYETAMCSTGMPYAGNRGRLCFEASMDSSLYYKDYKTYLVPLHAGTPVLITEDLAQVTSLLHDAIREVYKLDIPPVALADTFHDNLSARRFLISKNGFKKAFVGFAEPLFIERRGGGILRCRMQPAPPLKTLPEKWTNPYTEQKMNMTLTEVITLAEQTGAACITGAMQYWLGTIDENVLASVFGNNNYYTGLPIQRTAIHVITEDEQPSTKTSET